MKIISSHIGKTAGTSVRIDIGRFFDPDHVIYEGATSQLRAQGRPHADHLATLGALCSGAVRRGARRISFFDLPREDVTENGDWLRQMHREFCAEHGLSPVSVSLDRDGMLRDVVHSTDLGKQVYTDAFMGLQDPPDSPGISVKRPQAASAPTATSVRPALTGVARDRRLIHLRTAGRSLRKALAGRLAPGRIETCQPADSKAVQRMLDCGA
ncbi:hypothetical protein AL035_18835 [Salipiger aestuarii]|uniref:Uncharacterized protein n=1 Tax=Salipiger aestuarii TaxID=568098 RepID=A0A327XP98_9RHOB|nr:hypothetical protein [Salipiger aestuarii]KAB2538824.1 hypothetical protein AL035_18835 [Salipiger aestuarii]RAK09877.1 hypothetical protein ATI53_10644 [Salipiger aestuarii]